MSRDVTATFCDLFPTKGVVEMYSFSRPACLFWQGVYDVLTDEKGMTDEQVFEWMKSKATRWMLDASGEQITKLGQVMARRYTGAGK